MRTDTSSFPDATYRDTVLKPLFDGVKAHYAAGMACINRAHLLMLSEAAILPPSDVAALAKALVEIEGEVNAQSLTCLLYTSPSPRDKRQSRMPSSA